MIDYGIIDMHNHVYKHKISHKAVDGLVDMYCIVARGDGTSEGLLSMGSETPIKKYLICSPATTPEQVTKINDFIYSECEAHPEFYGIGTLHPYMDNIDEEIERIWNMGFRGVKFHPDYQKVDMDDPKFMELYKKIQDRFFVLMHGGDEHYTQSDAYKMVRVLDKFPDLRMIAAHFGAYQNWDKAKEVLIGRNVYMDTSSSLFALKPDEAAEMIRNHGVEKMFFGTDFPMWDPREELRRFMELPLTDEERKLILRDNACKFLGIEV